MSRTFRSDKVQIGERVVVRRRHGDHLSDVIGHVTALNPLTVRPQKVGGEPSTLDEIAFPAEEIQIVKKLSPRMVRNSDIRHIEEAYALAFPGIEQIWSSDGQWLLRAGDGVTERSNSAAPLGPSAGFVPVPVDEITAFYRRHELPVQLQIPERIGKNAERLVAQNQQSWALGPEILVMARDLDMLPDAAAPEALSFAIDPQPDEEWLSLYNFRGSQLPVRALKLLRSQIDGVMGFGRLRTPEGETAAITRATLTESGDGTRWLGYSAVEVAPAWRRQGLGTRLGAEILQWGAEQGADKAYLQVISTNEAGIALYTKLGFLEHHRHRYAHATGTI